MSRCPPPLPIFAARRLATSPEISALADSTSRITVETRAANAGDDDAKSFRPFTVGYVELPGALHVEARLTEPDPARLTIGQQMELVIEPFGVDADGNQTMIYAFAPVTGDGPALPAEVQAK